MYITVSILCCLETQPSCFVVTKSLPLGIEAPVMTSKRDFCLTYCGSCDNFPCFIVNDQVPAFCNSITAYAISILPCVKRQVNVNFQAAIVQRWDFIHGIRSDIFLFV